MATPVNGMVDAITLVAAVVAAVAAAGTLFMQWSMHRRNIKIHLGQPLAPPGYDRDQLHYTIKITNNGPHGVEIVRVGFKLSSGTMLNFHLIDMGWGSGPHILPKEHRIAVLSPHDAASLCPLDKQGEAIGKPYVADSDGNFLYGDTTVLDAHGLAARLSAALDTSQVLETPNNQAADELPRP